MTETYRNRLWLWPLVATLLLVSCHRGGGSGGGGASAPVAGSFKVSGQVFDAAVVGAQLEASLFPSFNPLLAGVTAQTIGDGTYSVSFDRSLLPPSFTHLYLRSKGGTDSGQKAPSLTGFAEIKGDSAIITLTAISTLIVSTLAKDPSANVTSAVETIAQIFGLSGKALNTNSATVTAGTTLEEASAAILRASSNANPGSTDQAGDLERLLNSLSDQLALGTLDTTDISTARTQLTTQRPDQLSHIPLISSKPYFIVTSVFIGGELLPTDGPVTGQIGEIRSTFVTSKVIVTGAHLPDIGVRFEGLPKFLADTTFSGSMSLVVKGRSPDKRMLTLAVAPMDAIVNSTRDGGIFRIPPAANLEASGAGADGNLTPVAVVPNLLQNPTVDLVSALNLVGSHQLTFRALDILNRIRSRLGLDPGNGPISLLESAGTFDITVTFIGLPIRTLQGHVGQIEMRNLVIQ